jgi:cell cycle arrest protein BUB2
MSAATAAATAHSFNKLLSQPKAASKSRATGETDDGTKKLRRMILVEGIPSALVRHNILGCSSILRICSRTKDPTLRPRIWKILLRVNELPSETYLNYISRGPCQVREKIRNDTFRYTIFIN